MPARAPTSGVAALARCREALLVAAVLLACAAPVAPAVSSAAASPSASNEGAAAPDSGGRTMADILAAAAPEDFRTPDPNDTLYLELASGRVVIELAPRFAPNHVANVEALAREGFYDGTAIVRVHENYVVQWADPDGTRPIRSAHRTLPAELERPAAGLPFTRLAEPDTYANEVGFSDGFPSARESATGAAWLVHCYGMLGAGRDVAPDSGGGTELYVVIGHAPRHLDRNVTLLGRVLSGMERLTALPRGTAPLGFYEKAEQRVPIQHLRVAADVPPAERTELEILRSDSATFQALVEARRNRREEWFIRPAGHIDLCNVPLIVRTKQSDPTRPAGR
ncbi:MAG TPA: peptidylprolyl isomerase [Polyangiaceae bacterium]|nr:peptidylprolyl isomerase [Polyangiaceae bacterium]